MARVRSKRPLHFPLTNQQLGKLFTFDLTAAEWRLYLCLVTLDPFGDVGIKYNAEELMLFCNIKKSTYFAAKAKFIELGLFEFVDGTTKVRNLKGIRANPPSEIVDFSSEGSEPRSEIVDFNSEVSEPHSEISELKTPEPNPELSSGKPHTLSDIIHTLSDSFTKPTHHPETDETRDKTKILDLEIQERKKNLIKENRDLVINDQLPPKKIDGYLDKEKPKVNLQTPITTNSPTPKKIGEDREQVPPPAAPEFSFLDWVKYYKAKDARNPLSYAQTCINRDEGSLRAEYERWLASRKNPVFSVYTPEPIVIPPPEERPHIIASVREILRSRGLFV